MNSSLSLEQKLSHAAGKRVMVEFEEGPRRYFPKGILVIRKEGAPEKAEYVLTDYSELQNCQWKKTAEREVPIAVKSPFENYAGIVAVYREL